MIKIHSYEEHVVEETFQPLLTFNVDVVVTKENMQDHKWNSVHITEEFYTNLGREIMDGIIEFTYKRK